MEDQYPNAKVAALIAGQVSICSGWSNADFADLALAAADQAGASFRSQKAIALLLPRCPRLDCDLFRGHDGDHAERTT